MKKSTMALSALFVLWTYSYMTRGQESQSANLSMSKSIAIGIPKEAKMKNKSSISAPKIESKKTQDGNSSKLEISTEELDALGLEAKEALLKNQPEEAIRIYREIIQKSQGSGNKNIFLYSVVAHIAIANIYTITDVSSAIEEYDRAIRKLSKKNSDEYQLLLIQTSLHKANLLDNDAKNDLQDQLIEKYKQSPSRIIQEQIDEMLISKSFDLMGKNDNEAMNILDSIIEKFRDKSAKEIPQYAKNSLINNIELSLMTGQDDSEYRDLATEYLKDEPDAKPLLDMLDIIKNAQDSSQDEQMSIWLEQHGKYRFNDWSFEQLEIWSNGIQDPQAQERVKTYLSNFEKQMITNN